MNHYKRHVIFFRIIRNLVSPIVKLIMGYRCERNELQAHSPCIIVANHNTDLDPALVAFGFDSHMYFVSSEHALRKGFRSMLIKYVFGPIPINKTRADASSVKEMVRRLRRGQNVCVFVEGNRSYTGVTGAIELSMAKLVKVSGASLITYRIEGGYFTSPRWAKKGSYRRGKMKGYMVNRYEPSTLKSMTNAQILRTMEEDIREDAYERQEENLIHFRGRHLAENLEVALYLCPRCGGIGTIHSGGSRFSCTCGLNGIYKNTGSLEGKDLPYKTIRDWTAWQTSQLAVIMERAGGKPFFKDENQRLYKVIPAKGCEFVGEGIMSMSREAFVCAGVEFPGSTIAEFAIVDQMTLLFSLKDGEEYEIRSTAPRSALKYLEMFQEMFL